MMYADETKRSSVEVTPAHGEVEVSGATISPDHDNPAFERSGRDAAISDARSGDNINDSTQRIRWSPVTSCARHSLIDSHRLHNKVN